MKHITTFVFLVFIIATSFLKAGELNKAQVMESYGKIPLSFTANIGQLDSDVKFTTKGNGATMFFTQKETTFLLSRETEKSIAKRTKQANVDESFNLQEVIGSEIEYYVLKRHFVNANSNPEVTGEDRLPWNNNYLIGNEPDEWQTDVPNYSKVRLKDIFNGIDLVYYGNQNKIKYDFVIQPGSDPKQIALSYNFGDDPNQECSISINQYGELFVKTPFGNLIERKPYCYQIINGENIKIEANYKIIDDELNMFTFSVANYNPEYSLVIDPELSYSTYVGGRHETGYDIAIDNEGNSYVSGYSSSSNYPTTSGVYDKINNGSWDIVITKLNSSGSELVYSTYIGGSNEDMYPQIAVDNSGNAYIAGHTHSSDFPVTPL